MKTIKSTFYRCEICKAEYISKAECAECESKPITQDKGVKIGDQVYITAGESIGSLATVEMVSVISKKWGHYQCQRYWHTVALSAKVINSWGSRFLTFDSYDTVTK